MTKSGQTPIFARIHRTLYNYDEDYGGEDYCWDWGVRVTNHMSDSDVELKLIKFKYTHLY